MFALPGTTEELPAVLLSLAPTSAQNAWRGTWYTLRLISDVPAIRVHSMGGTAAAAREALARSGRAGRWYAIGDVILTRQAYAAVHAIPGAFSQQDEWLLPVSTVLNVGRAGALFGHQGGGLQAEWISGPSPVSRPLRGYWSGRTGNA